MSIKGKLATIAIQRISEKVIHGDKVESAINSAVTRISKATGQKSSACFLQEAQKCYLIFKAKSYSLGSVIGTPARIAPDMSNYLGRYQIVSPSGAVKYKSAAERNFINGREILDIYDANDCKIGQVKEHIISTRVSLLEKEINKCSVYLGKEKIAELKKCLSVGELQFEVLEGDFKIEHKEDKEFKISQNGNLIASLYYVSFSLKDGYSEKFVLEYDDPSNETLAVTLAIAIDTINI